MTAQLIPDPCSPSNEDVSKPLLEAPTDMPLAAADQDTLKGGPFGGFQLNHNESIADEPEADEVPATAPTDLPCAEDLEVPTAQPVQGGGWGYSTSTIRLNHNETLVSEPITGH